MKTHITLMEGDTSSTKHYTIVDGQARPGQVKQAYFHDSWTIPIENLADLYDVIATARANPRMYIIRAQGLDDVQCRVRRRLLCDQSPDAHFYEMPTAWICCDFDKYEVPPSIDPRSPDAIEYLIDTILPAEFRNASYIYQWSSSAGLDYEGRPVKPGTNVHLFFYLDRALYNTELEAWFSKQIKEGFDGSTFRTVTPIFVGNHIVRDPAIVDTIPDADKFGIVAKRHDQVRVPVIKILPKPTRSQDTVPIETSDKILQTLRDIGAIYKRGSNYLSLKHPQERTPGGWYLWYNKPQIIHHPGHKAKRVDRWIKEFYGIDVDIEFEDARRPAVGHAQTKAANTRNENNLFGGKQ